MKLLLIFAAAVMLFACGPTVRQSPEFAAFRPQSFLVLPVAHPSNIKREKVDYLANSVLQELRSSGFVILDDAVVKRMCSDETCPERKAIAERYGVNALLELSIESVHRTNILAAYYNTISGTLRLLNASSQELLSVEHTQREKGGLLFNSGQVLQGLISSVKNAEEESYHRLADKFVKSLTHKLPQPSINTVGGRAFDAVVISSVSLKPQGDSRYEICADGSPQVSAYFLLGKNKASLREQSQGRYCGVFLLGNDVSEGTKLAVELRSPFGVVAQKTVDSSLLAGSGACDPSGLVKREAGTSAPSFNVECESEPDSVYKKLCEEKTKRCSSSQFVVYRGPTEAGPFEKVGILPSPSWMWTDVRQNEQKYYTVVAVSKEGFRSVPVPVVDDHEAINRE